MWQMRRLGSERLQELPKVTQQVRKQISPLVRSPGSVNNTIVLSRNDGGILQTPSPPSLLISLLESKWEYSSLRPTESGFRNKREQRLPPPCLGPPFAVTACLQEPEDSLSQFHSGETLEATQPKHSAIQGPGQLVSSTQLRWYLDFKNRHHPHMLG